MWLVGLQNSKGASRRWSKKERNKRREQRDEEGRGCGSVGLVRHCHCHAFPRLLLRAKWEPLQGFEGRSAMTLLAFLRRTHCEVGRGGLPCWARNIIRSSPRGLKS